MESYRRKSRSDEIYTQNPEALAKEDTRRDAIEAKAACRRLMKENVEAMKNGTHGMALHERWFWIVLSDLIDCLAQLIRNVEEKTIQYDLKKEVMD